MLTFGKVDLIGWIESSIKNSNAFRNVFKAMTGLFLCITVCKKVKYFVEILKFGYVMT